MKKIISWNVNGLRSVCRQGFLDWLKNSNADIVCLQEIKLQEGTLPGELLKLNGYNLYSCFAQKKGYSGVIILSRLKPIAVLSQFGSDRFKDEGRFIGLEFDDWVIMNLYLPHGGRQKENLPYKMRSYNDLFKELRPLKKPAILVGDFNIAHEEIDLARPKQNQKNIMFTPEERKQLDRLIERGYTDTFRQFDNDGGHYSWWPWMANARARNLGWRIDYCFISNQLLPKLKNAFILEKVFGSDHCPIGIDLET